MGTYDQETSRKGKTDRRYLPRWNTQLHAVGKKENGHHIHEGTVRNLSCAGACFSGEKVFAPNEEIHLIIDLLWEEPLRIKGTVCWAGQYNDQKMAGIHFVNVDKTVQDAILTHLKESEHVDMADIWFKEWK